MTCAVCRQRQPYQTSKVCSRCTARISQGALEKVLAMVQAALDEQAQVTLAKEAK